ncbi:MAG: winged helix-turn-helix transcriptional regulator [Euryarchaeota archaeon]|nr:winged helix-turn-helix transcriptional regulator [Euryarchaeota archaeon]
MTPDSEDIKPLIGQGGGYNLDWFTIIFKRPELEIESFESRGKTTQKTTQKILGRIKENPNITRKELAYSIGILEDGIKYHITNLKSMGLLERIDPDKGGYWRIVDNDE